MTQFRLKVSQKYGYSARTIHPHKTLHYPYVSCLHRTGLVIVSQSGFATASGPTAPTSASIVVAGGSGIFRRLPFVVLLEAGNNAQVCLALGAVVLGFAPQNSPMGIDRVPTEVAPECRALPYHRTVTGTLTVQAGNFGRSAACLKDERYHYSTVRLFREHL